MFVTVFFEHRSTSSRKQAQDGTSGQSQRGRFPRALVRDPLSCEAGIYSGLHDLSNVGKPRLRVGVMLHELK